jgi:PAS domain-containing protein
MSTYNSFSTSNQPVEYSHAKKRCHHRAVSNDERKAPEPETKHARFDLNDNEDDVLESQETAEVKHLLEENIELQRQVRILSSVPDVIVVFDLDGNINYTNSEDIKEIISFWDMLTPSSGSLIQTAITNALVN